jgi:glycosyltransferase involved in cell wall biosynthesis
MRVVMLSKALVVGAYQRKCELIAAHSSVALTVLTPPGWAGTSLERAHTRGYDLRAIPIRFDGNFHLHHYPTLQHELARLKPDVLHIDEEPYNLATWLAQRAAGRTPTVWFSWQNLNRRYPPPFAWFERDVLARSQTGIVGNAESERVWRSKGFGGPLHVLPQFGVDETVFAPVTGVRPARPFTVGWAGRMIVDKGVDTLIRAAARVDDMQVRLLGTGEAQPALQTLVAELGLTDRVTFETPRPSTEMPGFFQMLDAFALPSRTRPNWKEQFGRVLIEAMACAVPVIGSDSGEIPNVIGPAGLISPEDDIAGLAAHLTRLRDDAALRQALGAAGRARVQERYTMQRIADATVEIWRGCA